MHVPKGSLEKKLKHVDFNFQTTSANRTLYASTNHIFVPTGRNNLETTALNLSEYPSVEKIEMDYFLKNNIPVVLFLTLLSIIGVTGNIHTLVVYATSQAMKERAVRVFILWLSAIDFTGCLILLPFEMFEIRHQYTFTSSGTCKFFRYLGHVVSFSSCSFLMAIAFERYMILRKKQPRVNVKPATILNGISIVLVLVSLLFSVPFIIYFGIKEIKVPDYSMLIAYECTATLDAVDSELIIIYAIMMIVLIVSFFLVIAVVYGKILFDFYRINSEIRKANSIGKSTADASSVHTMKDDHSKCQNQQENEKDENYLPAHSSTMSRNTDRYNKVRQLTITLIVATGVSSFGYFIYIVTAIVLFVVDPELYNTSAAPFFDIFLRFYLVNNVANPIVYFLKDDKFRSECKSLYQKCFERFTQNSGGVVST